MPAVVTKILPSADTIDSKVGQQKFRPGDGAAQGKAAI